MNLIESLFVLALVVVIAYTIVELFLASRFYKKLEKMYNKEMENIDKILGDDE